MKPPRDPEALRGAAYRSLYDENAAQADRMFAALFAFQWFLGIVFAFFVSPYTWVGEASRIHIHIYAAIFLGGLASAFPIFLVWNQPGAKINRFVVTISQLTYSILFIHLTGGRIETHFHIFGSLAFLAFYLDPKVLLLATAITAVDHAVRGALWPESVYGVLSASPLRALEHAAWVIFEDIFLFLSIARARAMFQNVAKNQIELQSNFENIERLVDERTRELRTSQATVLNQQEALISSAKMSALGEMAGGIAHEVNNPLAVLKNVSSQIREVVREHPTDRETVLKMATRLETTTDRIAKIISGLRSFSRDGSQDPIHEINLSRLVDDTLAFCSERFRQNQVELSVECGHDIVIDGRSTEISQVLLNLLNNAYDAIADLPEKWVRVGVTEKDNHVEIRVTDSGSGISPAIKDKLFAPFFTTKEVGKGTGLGLSISLGIIHNHGGELFVDSGLPNTSFVIRLPKPKALSARAA